MRKGRDIYSGRTVGLRVLGLLIGFLGVCAPLSAQTTAVVTTNAGDAGAGSLGWAVTTLNAGGGGAVSFTPAAGSVTLTQPLPPLSQSTTFEGSDLTLTGQSSGQAQLLFQQGFHQQDNLVLQNNGALGSGLDASVTAANWTMDSGAYFNLFAATGAATVATGGTGIIGNNGGNASVAVGQWTVGQGALLNAGNGGGVTDTNGSGDVGGAGGSVFVEGGSLTAPGYFFQINGGMGGSVTDLGTGTNRGGTGGSASVSFNSISSGPSGNFYVDGGRGGAGVTGGLGGAAALNAGAVSLTQGLVVQGGNGGSGTAAGGAGGSASASIGSYVGLATSTLSVVGGAGGSGPLASGGNAFYSGNGVSLGANSSFNVTGGNGGDVLGASGNGGNGGNAGVSLTSFSMPVSSALFNVVSGNGGQGASGTTPGNGGQGGNTAFNIGTFSVGDSPLFTSGTGGRGGDATSGGTGGAGGVGGSMSVSIGTLSLGPDSNLQFAGGQGGAGGSSTGTGGQGGEGGQAAVNIGTVDFTGTPSSLLSTLAVQGGAGGTGGSGTSSGTAGPQGNANLSIGDLEGYGAIVLNGSFALLQVSSGDFSGYISGGESLQKTGSGALTLSGNNSYSGGTVLLGGTLAVDTGGTLGTAGVQVTGGTNLRYLGSASATGSVNVLSGGNLYFQDASSAGSAQVALGGQAVFANSSTAGSATLNVSSGGILAFQDSSGAGNALINDGNSVQFLGSSSAGSASVSVAAGGTLSFRNSSGGGGAFIDDKGQLTFFDTSTADGAQVVVENGGMASFVNTAQGGTSRFVLNGGTLDISGSTAGVTLGSLASSVSAPGNVNLGAEGLAVGVIHSSTTFSGVISGTGSFTKLGTDGLTLAGVDTYSGGTLVAGGTLAVADSLALGTGSVTVAGGTLDLSGAGSPLTLRIGGDYLQSGGLQLGLENGASDAVSVGGNAGLGGTLDLAAYAPVTALPIGQSVTVMTAAGSLSGMFGNVAESLGSGVRYLPVYYSDRLELESIHASFAGEGATSNEKAVGADLDVVYGSGSLYGLVSQLGVMPSSGLPAAYDQISPAGLAGLYQAGFAGALARSSLVEERMFQFMDQPGTEGPSRREARMARGWNAPAWSGFVSGQGGFLEAAADGNAPGYKAASYGLAGAGADYRLSRNAALGLLVGYGHTSLTLDSGGTLTGDGGRLGVYGLFTSQGFFADALAQGGLDNYGLQRATYGGTAAGSTRGRQYGGAVEAGYEFRQDRVSWGPLVSFQYTRVEIDGFSESGSLSPLTFPGQGQDSLAGRLGVRGQGNWKLGTMDLKPSLQVAWDHEYDNRGGVVTAGFGAGDNFTVAGPVLGQDGVLVGAGLGLGLSRNLELSLHYRGDLGRTHFAAQQFDAGARLGF